MDQAKDQQAPAWERRINLQLFAGSPPTDPTPAPTDPAPAPQYTSEDVDRWRQVAESYEQHVATLAQREAALASQQQQLDLAAKIQQAMDQDPAFRTALQQAYAQQLQGAPQPQPQGWQVPQDPGQQPQVDPRLVAFLQQTAQGQQQLAQQVQSIQENQRQSLIQSQVEAMKSQYEFARPEEVIALALDYPTTDLKAAMAASDAHWKSEFQRWQQAQEQKRQANARNSTLGPSGGIAAPADKTMLATAQGRRSLLQQAAAMLANSQQGG